MSDFWRDRPTLVTGATGFAGRHLVQRLHTHGSRVVSLIHRPPASTVPGMCIAGNITDHDLLHRILHEHGIDTIFHLAAQTTVGRAHHDPVTTLETNIRGTWALLEAARLTPSVRQIIIASSDKAYGASDELPYREDMPLRPEHPYDVSKACADLLAQTYANTWQLPVAITRCGNFFGPGDLNFTRLVPATIRAVLRGERPRLRSDGRSVRDYFFIREAVAAKMQLAERLAQQPELRGQAFNFAAGHCLSTRDMVRTILDRMQSDLEPVILDHANGEIPHQMLDTSKAATLLNWQPRYNLHEALDETIAWYREHLKEETKKEPLINTDGR